MGLPVGLVETVVASSGLSEAVPAAAPPLGLTARLVLAGFAGVMVMGLLGFMRRAPEGAAVGQDEAERVESAQGAKKMGFAFSKLTAMARGRAAPLVAPDAPSLRRADAHPDAPPRPPIFASRDFDGIEIFARPESARPESGRRPLVAHREPEAESIVPTPGFTSPEAPMPVAEAPVPQPAFLRPVGPFAQVIPLADVAEEGDEQDNIAQPQWAEARTPRPVEPALAPLPLRAPTHGLSVGELTDRLERGLALRSRATMPAAAGTGVIADMPVAAAVPVREAVARDTDEALRAALGALRTMTGRR
ncbi:hypothetical protein [Sphingobium sp. CAP-1]|uniref:hypothetical protein n=1 Tax=Sphingobium sp. CAP-1 TaxID=2676077 RepID=UPI001E647DFB|nr:hypothetical protein [Sphingobium sp. CAP-1]